MQKSSWHPLLIQLMQASIKDPKRARTLVRAHPDILNLRTGLGETVLHYLAVENYAEAVALLIELGAKVNVTNTFGNSPLFEARSVRAAETVAVLERAGAKLSPKDEHDIAWAAFFSGNRKSPPSM